MKFVILHRKLIPGFDVNGPILTPAEYDIHQVLRWISVGIDIREVMEDGSYRKLAFNDERLMEELNKKLNKQMEKRKQQKDDQQPRVGSGNVKLVPEKRTPKPVVAKPQPKVEPKKEEPQPEPKVEEVVKEEPKQQNLFIDELERPE